MKIYRTPESLPEHFKALPEAWLKPLADYLEYGKEPGSFLMSVLQNDLAYAVSRADPSSLQALPLLVKFLINEFPMTAWRGYSEVRRWIQVRQAANPQTADLQWLGAV